MKNNNLDYEKILVCTYTDSVEILKLTEALCEQVIVDKIPGDFAEAGVANGMHGVIMSNCSVGQKVHMFDSFKGIPLHGPEDLEWAEVHGHRDQPNVRVSGGITSHSLVNVIQTMRAFVPSFADFVWHQGWFHDTLPLLSNERFSVIRLDGDLYDSYKISFEYLYPRLSIGGWMILDDWNLSGCQKAFYEYFHDGVPKLQFLRDNAYFQKIWE